MKYNLISFKNLTENQKQTITKIKINGENLTDLIYYLYSNQKNKDIDIYLPKENLSVIILSSEGNIKRTYQIA